MIEINMKNKTQYIADFLMDGNPKRFEKTSESAYVAFETFSKQNPTIKVAPHFFVRVYDALVHSKRFQSRRVCRISDLLYGTYFSIRKKGNVFASENKYIKPGKKDYIMAIHYFGVNTRGHFHGHIHYPLHVVRSKTIFLKDEENTASTRRTVSKIQKRYEL